MSAVARALAEFHAALGDAPGRGNARLRATLHWEEHRELMNELEECRVGDGPIPMRWPRSNWLVNRSQLARELADVVYVAYGTAHAFDIDLDAALAEIHRAAMSKLGPDKVVRDDGKILKGPNFQPPDMRAAVLCGCWPPEPWDGLA